MEVLTRYDPTCAQAFTLKPASRASVLKPGTRPAWFRGGIGPGSGGRPASATMRVYSSVAVLDELERGDYASKEDAIRLMDDIPLLEIGEGVQEVVEVYIRDTLMPADTSGDALHWQSPLCTNAISFLLGIAATSRMQTSLPISDASTSCSAFSCPRWSRHSNFYRKNPNERRSPYCRDPTCPKGHIRVGRTQPAKVGRLLHEVPSQVRIATGTQANARSNQTGIGVNAATGPLGSARTKGRELWL